MIRIYYTDEEMLQAVVDRFPEYRFLDYEISRDGIYLLKPQPGRSKEPAQTIVSPIFIAPSAMLYNDDSGIEKVELCFYKNGSWNKLICDRSVVASHTAITKLADKGVEVSTLTSRDLVEYLFSIISENMGVIPRYKAKSVMGWCDGEFMPYDSGMVFDGEDQFKYLYRSIVSKGDHEAWTEYASELRKNKLLRLVMAASFASPLIELVGENPFVLHLWGGTGSAKTVSLMVAMSIWGNPALGAMVRTMNMTANAMLSTAAFLRNLPFAGDELQTIKSRWNNSYDNLIMCVTEGVDRGRMSYDRVNEIKSWKCSFCFPGKNHV